MINDAGLTVGTVTTRPDSEAEEGTVIEQSPVAGIEIDPGEPVDIVVSEGAEEFELPNLVGMEDGEAFAELNSLDLEWETISEESSEPEGTVIRTQPPPGTLVRAGDTITVVVSEGTPTTFVPNLVGLTFDQAQNELENAGLDINPNAPIAPTSDPNLDGRVIGQEPPAGAEVDEGTTVTVTLGDFQEPATTSPPTTTAN
jgi:serine/threonine-protein kinase